MVVQTFARMSEESVRQLEKWEFYFNTDFIIIIIVLLLFIYFIIIVFSY